MSRLLINIIRKTGIIKIMVKIFAFMLKETMRKDHSILNLVKKIQKEEYNNKKLDFIKKFKSFGDNSHLWGEIHTITCPMKLEIGENVHIGNNSYIKAEGGVSIGDNTHISRNLLLYSINHNYEGENLPYDEKYNHKPVSIGRNVWIGMNVCITPGTIIGEGTIIGMGTTVSGVVPPLSIIGSQKWRIIGKRDKAHYESLDLKGRYGGINGQLYINPNKLLLNIGDKKNSRRNNLEVINFMGKKGVKKTFLDTKDGSSTLKSEKLAIIEFQKYKWFPKVYEINDNYIVYEYFENEFRLDKYIPKCNDNEKITILKEVIEVLLDIFTKDMAHRDFHGKNIFYLKEHGIKLIDFETITSTEDLVTDFFNSYDIIGQGLESPYYTNNMCVFSQSKYSIKNLFNIGNINQFKILTESVLIENLYEISSSFYTRKNSTNNRHFLKKQYIYNTFDLPYLKIDPNIGQRNIKKRLHRFGIDENMIVGKKILDLGSNIGGILFELQKMKPSVSIGIEYDKDKVEISNTIAKIHGFKNIQFLQMDVESTIFNINFSEQYDVVFCLALIEHLNDKEKFIKKLSQICKEYLFFEANEGSDIKEINKSLKNAGFKSINFLGLSDDEKDQYNNLRPLFVCHK